MIEKVTTSSRTEAQKLACSGKHTYDCVIQILGSSEGTFPKFNKPCLKLRFEDDHNIPEGTINTIVSFATRQAGNLLIHCYAGKSRSVAAAMILEAVLGIEYTNRPPWPTPNQAMLAMARQLIRDRSKHLGFLEQLTKVVKL